MKRYHRLCAVLLVFLLTAGLTPGCAKEEQAVKGNKEHITLWYYCSQSYRQKELAYLADRFNRSQDVM